MLWFDLSFVNTSDHIIVLIKHNLLLFTNKTLPAIISAATQHRLSQMVTAVNITIFFRN